MHQPSAYYFTQQLYNQDGSGAATQQWLQDQTNKSNQFQPHQWENSGFHVTTSNNYGPGQVQGGGGQNRVNQLGQQQQQQPSQPTPTSTPPGIHGDMNKQPLMQNQQPQLNFVRPSPNLSFSSYTRPMQQPPQIRHNARIMAANNYTVGIPQVISQPGPAPAIVQAVPSQFIMYGQPRQGTPYPNQGMFVQAQQPYYNHPQPYYPTVISQTPYQSMSSGGGPSPQTSTQQQQPVQQMMRANIVPTASVAPPVKQEPKKRTYAIKIIDPSTNEEVIPTDDNGGNNNNITPTRSNDSSARETPQPSVEASVASNTVAAEFAAKVAACAMAPDTFSPSDPVQDSLNSDSDVHHKQPFVVPSSEKVFNTTLSTSSEEFVPRSLKLASEPPIEEPRTTITTIVPTVSAETNSPAIDIRPKESYQALKNPSVAPGPVAQSPMRVNSKKQKGSEIDRQPSPSLPSPPPASPPPPLPPVENKEVGFNNKKGPKAVVKEESVPISKDKREKTRSFSKEQSPALSPVAPPEIPSSQPEVTPVPVVKAASSASTGMLKKEVVKSNNVVVPSEEPPAIPVSKIPQHQNGEAALTEPVVTVDGNKTSRQKSKKGGKMRDLNRKGVEKEGSEMDAFTTEPTIVSEEKERPATPISPPPPAIQMTPTPPPPTLEPVAPSSPVDKIKEDLEEKEDKLVAAKNEENAKVSALSQSRPEEEEPAAVIEKAAPAQLTLKHSYKKDQWSPLNPDGKKKYDRDFLFNLKDEIQSNVKPDNLPDVVAVLKDSSNMFQMRNSSMSNFNRGDMNIMAPAFMRNSQSQRGPLPKRGSQQGNKGGKGNPKVIHMSLSKHEDVKLKTSENAWKPNRLEAEAGKPEEEKQTEELFKNVRGILNKLTPQKFDTLMKKFMALPINSESRLEGVINLIFHKAVDEPSFSKAYANMCKICSKMEVNKVVEQNKTEKVNFRKLLITRCQTEFEKNKKEELDANKKLENIHNCNDPEKKKELQLQFEEEERRIRMKSVGNIRFIGELFKLHMLTPAIMYRCIEHLLQTPEEESLECLCKLLTTIGKDLEFGAPSQTKPPQSSLNPYFQKMADLAQKKDGSKVSSRVRFMLQDVIELRQNKWVPRREDNNPKTIEQITKEAERESIETSMALLNQQPPRMNRQNDRQDDRKRGNRGGNNQSEDGWVSVGTRHFNKYTTSTPAFEASKMQNMVKPDMDFNSLSLGGSSMFRFNTQAAKTVDSKPGFVSSNAFSALSRGDERKPPPNQSNMNNRRITSTPSIERDKERQRMILGAMESEGRSSRGNSAQRERPQPPSSDGSQPPVDKDNREGPEAVSKLKRDEIKNTMVVDEDKAREAEALLERQTKTIFAEYLSGYSSVDDVREDIQQKYPAEKVGVFVEKALSIALEEKAGAQKNIGLLITALMDYNLFTPEVVVEQFGFIYEMADDIAIDVPKVWELQAEIIAPILVAEKIDFSHFRSACSSVLKTSAAPKLLNPVLSLLVKEKGAGFVRKVWDASKVSLKDFLSGEEDVDAFIKINSLEYLTGEAPKYDSSSSQLSMDQVQEKMLRLIQNNQPYEKILDYISTNVGDKVEDLQFIRALITAICEACLDSNFSLDFTKFKQYENLIQKFVEHKEDRELACLSSVHTLVNSHQHPQGLITNLFNLLWEDNVISNESFLKWKADDHEMLENKGVSFLSLRSFFTALEEGDGETDDENS